MKQLLHTPEGVRDVYNSEYARKLAVEERIRETLNLYGYQDIQTPSFEFFDIFGKEKGSVASKDMFKFFDRDGNTLVLRPDMTPSVVRCATKYFSEEPIPVRLSYLGNTYINYSGYQGRLKESTDAGAELIGDGSADADAELVAMVVDCLLKAGLAEFQIELGHAGFFTGLLNEAGIGEEEREELNALFNNKNYFGLETRVSQLPIPEENKEVFRRLPELFGTGDVLTKAKAFSRGKETREAIGRLEKVYELLAMYGVQKYVSFDLGMIVTYRYYTGVIFKGYTYGMGDTIVSGGRYDTLTAQFGKARPSVGFKISVDGLLTAMERQKISVETDRMNSLVVYEPGQQALGIMVAKQLRDTGLKLALYSLREHSLEEFIGYGKRTGMGGIVYIGEDGKSVELIDLQAGTRKPFSLSGIS